LGEILPLGLLLGEFLGQNMVCCVDFKSSEKGLMLIFWTFKLSFDEDILSFFRLATDLATFSKNWANFFLNLLVTLVADDLISSQMCLFFG
jgi:hypothetical protein